jgi:hypothetical protein
VPQELLHHPYIDAVPEQKSRYRVPKHMWSHVALDTRLPS